MTKTKTVKTDVDTSLKDCLLAGATEEDLMKMLKDQIKEAKDEIAAEQKAKEEEVNKHKAVTEARTAMVVSLTKYLTALGLLEDELTEEEIADICEAIENLEKDNFFSFIPVKKKSSRATETHDLDIDNIIEEFLRTLT